MLQSLINAWNEQFIKPDLRSNPSTRDAYQPLFIHILQIRTAYYEMLIRFLLMAQLNIPN
jgi:hypothetical protein